MNKSNTVLQITSEVLGRYRNSIPRKAFVRAMEQVIDVAELQLIRASELDVEQISQLISGACPPFSLDHGDYSCQEHECQECWKSWLLTGMPPKKEK